MKQYILALIPRQPQQWFVWLALIFGTLFVFVTPPLKVPDELGHMTRAWGIADGHWLDTKLNGKAGSYIPSNLNVMGEKTLQHFTPADIANLQSLPLLNGNYTFVEHPNMALYSPLVYAPQAVGFIAARNANLPAIDAFYLARLFNVFAYVALVWTAIRLLPFGKWAGMAFGLLPMHILLAGSMSADPVSIGLAMLIVAAVLKLRSLPRELTQRQYWLLAGLTAAVSLTKLPFALLLILLLFVPPRVLGGTRTKWWLCIGGLASLAICVGGGWLALAQQTLVAYGPDGANASLQFHALLTHPLQFARAFFITFFMQTGDGFMAQYVVCIGWVATSIPLWLTYAYGIFAAFTVFPLRTASAAVLGRGQKIVVAALGAASIGIIGLLLYLSWTPVGGKVIDGIQARYITPFLILLIPLLAVRSKKVQDGSLPKMWYVVGAGGFLLASLLMSVYYFYIK